MNILLGQPFAASEKGKRKNNEDAVYPLPEVVSSEDSLFLVCDGVGGENKGEIASCLTCEMIPAFFRTFLIGEINSSFIQKSVQYVETCFDQYVTEHPEAIGMATTMAMLYIERGTVVIAHIGDSRVYQIREGHIIFQTEDHSLVNSWVKLGRITEEEARIHPQKNIILRAIQGKNHPTEVDVSFITDVKDGDIFFMCTDGVIESWRKKDLENLFAEPFSLEKIKDTLVEVCSENSRDNFSFYLIPVKNVQKKESLTENFLTFLYSFI